MWVLTVWSSYQRNVSQLQIHLSTPAPLSICPLQGVQPAAFSVEGAGETLQEAGTPPDVPGLRSAREDAPCRCASRHHAQDPRSGGNLPARPGQVIPPSTQIPRAPDLLPPHWLTKLCLPAACLHPRGHPRSCWRFLCLVCPVTAGHFLPGRAAEFAVIGAPSTATPAAPNPSRERGFLSKFAPHWYCPQPWGPCKIFLYLTIDLKSEFNNSLY